MSIFLPVHLLIFMVFILFLPLVIGVYVYRDAQRRGMNGLLWALVAALAPSFIGLIVYLLVRGNYSDLKCPQCGATVTEQYAVCPRCGVKLRPGCPNCSRRVEPDWRVCPHCAQPLPQQPQNIQPPVKTRDRTGWKVVLMIILIPILLIAMLVLGFSAYTASGSAAYRAVSFEEYKQEMNTEGEPEIAEKVLGWIESLEVEQNHAYALRYDHAHENGNESYFLVYVPGAGAQISAGLGQSSSIFGTTLTLSLAQTGNGGNCLFNLTSSAEDPPNLKVELDGKKISCEVTVVDYNPTLFYIVPQYDELTPGESIFMPERVLVTKIVGNHHECSLEVKPEDLALNILAEIDGAPYLDIEHNIYPKPDESGGYDFTDGYEIRVEYEVHEEYVLHGDMLRLLAFEQEGAYYLIDERPEDGRFIRELEQDFYLTLQSLFEE